MEIPDEGDSTAKLLKNPSSLYAIPAKKKGAPRMTLVLDLDETLIHFHEISEVKLKHINNLTPQEYHFGGYYMI